MTSRSHTRTCIAFVNLYTEMGGGEYAIYNLLKELDKTRFRPIMLFSRRGSFVEKVESIGVETAILPYETVMLKRLANPVVLWKTMKASREVHRLLKAEEVALIHCGDVLALVLVMFPVLRLRLPVVYSVIFFYEWSRLILFNLLALLVVDRILSASNIVKEDLVRRTLFLSRKSETVHNGVDSKMFHPAKDGERNVLRQELKLDPHERLVGMVGRIDPAKGQRIFLRAAARVLETRRNVTFVAIGGLLNVEAIPVLWNYHREVMLDHERLGLGDRMRFIDHRDDMPEVLRSLDVLVCPSVSEGFGLVVLEGLATGIPVVASRTVGAMEVVRDLPGVFEAEVSDADSLADRIMEALDASAATPAPPKRRVAGKIINECTWQQHARHIERVYTTLVPPVNP